MVIQFPEQNYLQAPLGQGIEVESVLESAAGNSTLLLN